MSKLSEYQIHWLNNFYLFIVKYKMWKNNFLLMQ